MLDAALAGLLALSLALYAILGGADFGGGVLDLLARGPLAARSRRAIAIVMGPVWEANHVWLIFAVTLAFTAYPRAFAAASEALYVPWSFALLGIVLRGAAFAFRSHGAGVPGFRRAPGIVFGAASVLAPACLGASAGALASGRIRIDPEGHAIGSAFSAWTGPLSLAAAIMAVAACAYLASAYMAYEAAAANEPDPESDFRRKAIAAGLLLSILAPAGLLVVRAESPLVWQGLLGRGAAAIGISGAAGIASLLLLRARRYALARASAALAIASVLGGWVIAQWPMLIVPDVTASASSAPPATRHAMLIAIAVGAALLLPSLWLLYRVFGRRPPS